MKGVVGLRKNYENCNFRSNNNDKIKGIDF